MRQAQLFASPLLIHRISIGKPKSKVLVAAKPGLKPPVWSHKSHELVHPRSHVLRASRDFASDASPAAIDMEVTRHNFATTLPVVSDALSECTFYAFDCEMTGLFVKSNGNNNGNNKASSFLDDIEDRYEELLESSNAFVINQFGLSCFIWDELSSSWTAKTFNFYTFPHPFEEWEPRFLSEASSLQFLAKCHFDFNKWIHDGIPYMPCSLRDLKLKAMDKSKELNSRPDIVPTKQFDIDFVENLIKLVRNWLHNVDDGGDSGGGAGGGGDFDGGLYSGSDYTDNLDEDSEEDFCSYKSTEEYLRLESVNSYQRALQYQTLRNAENFDAEDPPGFYIERVENIYGKVALKLIRATSAQIAAYELEQKQKRMDEIDAASSFCQILELMRDSRKPAVGHNLSFDLAYTLNSFAKPLPPTWMEFKDRVKRWFPGGVYDTKYIASNYSDIFTDTSLGEMYKAAILASELGSTEQQSVQNTNQLIAVEIFDAFRDKVDFSKMPKVGHAAGFARYNNNNNGVNTTSGDVTSTHRRAEAASTGAERVGSAESFAHEAGYDAYMTGTVFATFLSLLYEPKEEEETMEGGEVAAATAAASRLSSEFKPVSTLEYVDQYCWRMNMSRSDMGYASLWGPDNVPPRKNILYLTQVDPTKFRHGGEIIKKLNQVKELVNGGYIRVSVLGQGGTTALLELPKEVESDALLRQVAEAVENALPGCCVKDFDAYRTVKAMQRAGMDIDDDTATEDAVVLPAKRPRTESAEEKKQAALQSAAENSRCSIM